MISFHTALSGPPLGGLFLFPLQGVICHGSFQLDSIGKPMASYLVWKVIELARRINFVTRRLFYEDVG